MRVRLRPFEAYRDGTQIPQVFIIHLVDQIVELLAQIVGGLIAGRAADIEDIFGLRFLATKSFIY